MEFVRVGHLAIAEFLAKILDSPLQKGGLVSK